MIPNYYVETRASSITAWSTAQIPFEPRDWLLVFRDQLKSAIAGLPSGGGKILYAAYGSAVIKYGDVENVLIYNIGPAQLSDVTKNGLVFRRFYEISRACPVELSSPPTHQYEYSLVDGERLSIEAQRTRPLASLSFDLTASALHSAATVWYAAKKGSITLAQQHHTEGPWGMFITINSSSDSPIACSKIVKPLIDGITSALHCHDGSNMDYLAKQLAKNLGLDDDRSVRSFLQDGGYALFGQTTLLRRYRNNLQWYPKDDSCTYCLIRCLYGLRTKGLGISALIFDTRRQDAV